MDVKQSLQNVADAWERVFEDVGDLGKQLGGNLRNYYAARSDAEAAFGEGEGEDESAAETEAAEVKSAAQEFAATVSTTVRVGLEAAKSAVTDLADQLGEGRGEALGREAESALKTSLQEIGAMFTTLANRLRGSGNGEGTSED